MLAYAAVTGQRALAMKHIRAMVAQLPADFSRRTFGGRFCAMPMEVMVRRMWDEFRGPDNYADMMTDAPSYAARAGLRRRAKSAPRTGGLSKSEARPERGFWATTPRGFARLARHDRGEIPIRENKLMPGLRSYARSSSVRSKR
jgi:hypothetical protein